MMTVGFWRGVYDIKKIYDRCIFTGWDVQGAHKKVDVIFSTTILPEPAMRHSLACACRSTQYNTTNVRF